MAKPRQEIESNKNEKILIILRKRVLKHTFGQSKELQEKVVPLSNMISNKLDDLVDSSNGEDVISRRQNRNVTSSQRPAIRRDRVVGHSEPEEEMEGAKRDTSDINFFYQGIIKYN